MDPFTITPRLKNTLASLFAKAVLGGAPQMAAFLQGLAVTPLLGKNHEDITACFEFILCTAKRLPSDRLQDWDVYDAALVEPNTIQFQSDYAERTFSGGLDPTQVENRLFSLPVIEGCPPLDPPKAKSVIADEQSSA